MGAFTMYYPPEWKVSGQNLNKVAFELPGLTILIVEVSQLQTKMSDQDTQDALVAVAVQDQFAKGNMVTNVEKGVWEHYPQGHYVLLDVEGDDSRASQTLYVVSYLGDTNVGSANLFKLWAKITDAEKETVAAVFASIRPKDWGTGGPSAIVEATPLPIATPQVMAEKVVNLRAGPGTNYPKAGATEAGDKLTVVGRTADGSWLEVCCVNEKTVWVAASVVTILGDAKSVSVAKTIPTPPPAPTRVPTSPPAPLAGLHQRQTIGTWEIQPERVHKEKAVYLYGDSYVAMGNYAIVIVLAKNVASGTQDLAQTLALALKDDKGRLYSYSDPYTTERYANQAACWEFVVHPSPFHEISPGEETPLLMLWDVKEDVQSLTLYIEDERGNAAQWNLGDFSDIPPFKK